MKTHDLGSLRQEIIEATRRLLASGIMQVSHHGNMSIRVPGTDTFLLTAVGGLDDLKAEHIALLDFEGKLLEGSISPTSVEIVNMHGVVYQLRDGVGSVLHTHSPYATAFALAHREIPVAYEAQVRSLGTIPVPVAGWGPRGSRESVNNISRLLRDNKAGQALLLANHGTLTWGDNPSLAVRANVILEESALVHIMAERIGGAKPIPTQGISTVLKRRIESEQAGIQKA